MPDIYRKARFDARRDRERGARRVVAEHQSRRTRLEMKRRSERDCKREQQHHHAPRRLASIEESNAFTLES